MKYDIVELGTIGIDVIDGDRGKNYPHQNELFPQGDCVFLSANNVTSAGFMFDNLSFITHEKDRALRNGKLQRNDIVITTRGTVGNVAFYDDSIEYDSVRINSGMLIVRCHDDVDCRFLYYVLRSSSFRKQIRQIQTGTAQPQLPKSHFLKMNIVLPPKAIQSKIADLLCCIEDRIKTNTAINQNLAEQAQGFLYYFMDEYPYALRPLSEIAEVIDCLHSKKPSSVEDSTYQLIQLDNIRDDGFLDMSACKYMISQSDYENWTRKCEIVEGDCVITNVGRIGAVAQAPYGTHAAMGRNMTCIRLKPGYELHAYFITALLSKHMRRQIQSNTDEGTIMGALNVKNIPKLLFPMFDRLEMSKLESVLNPIRKQIEYNNLQNQSLAQIRDALLPKLMCGEIDVSKIEI